ncbi:MAG: MATE family efflux transporter [Deltaproteobacteria bacterium]|nr:MATE family efflux transporter [Deltaproteobacteria bacterium]
MALENACFTADSAVNKLSAEEASGAAGSDRSPADSRLTEAAEDSDYSNDLIVKPIPLLIARIAVPASLGFFFNTMFNATDTYFAGFISTESLAALSLSFPVFFIIIAVGSGLSTGTTALIANEIGAGRRQKAGLFAFQGLGFGIITALIVTVAGIAIAPRLFSFLGASEQYLRDALHYMNTIFGGTIFFICNFMLNAVLVATGDTRSFRNFLIAGFFLNLVLDPWFMFGGFGVPSMGIRGIALATVIIQFFGVAYLALRVSRTDLMAGSDMRRIIPRLAPFREIARQGLPAAVNMLTVGLGVFVITYFAGRFGKQAVAAYGAAVRLEQIILLPTIGLNTATLTLAAQNFGARRFDRLRAVFFRCLRYGAVIAVLGAAALLLGAPALMKFFTSDPIVIAYGATYLKIAAFLIYAYVMLFLSVSVLQGVKRPFFAIGIGIIRQIVLPVIVFPLFSIILSMGLKGLWWGIFAINWSAALFSIVYALKILKKIEKVIGEKT